MQKQICCFKEKLLSPMIFMYSILNFSYELKVKAIQLNTRGLWEYFQNLDFSTSTHGFAIFTAGNNFSAFNHP